MGTHPIFESDFDCLNRFDLGLINSSWSPPFPKHSRRSASCTRRLWPNVPLRSKTPRRPASSSDVPLSSAPPLTPRSMLRLTAPWSRACDRPRRTVMPTLLVSKIGTCHPYPWYQPGFSPRQEDPPALAPPSNRQRHFCQAEQGHQHDVEHCSALHHLGLPQPQDRPRVDLQARSRQDRRWTARRLLRQCCC